MAVMDPQFPPQTATHTVRALPKTLPLRIAGTGHFLPPRVQTSAELARVVGRSEEWITRRSGVVSRHLADRPVEEMAAEAARQALGDGPAPDLILNASLTPRQLIPDTSVFVQRALGLSGIPSYSVHATCLSFLVALHQATMAVAAGAAQRVLVVSSEAGSYSRDYSEPESAVLIGDAAAAAVVEAAAPGAEAGPPSAMLAWRMQTFPEAAELAELPGSGVRHHPNDPSTERKQNLFHMNGPRIYRFARTRIGPFLDDLLDAAQLTRSDIDVVVPHQASGPGLASLQRLGFPKHKVVDIIANTGNCIAASIPLALSVAHAEGRIARGDRVLLVGTGAGLSLAGMVIRF